MEDVNMKIKFLAVCLTLGLLLSFSLPVNVSAASEAELAEQLKALRAEQEKMNETIKKLERELSQRTGASGGEALEDRLLKLEEKVEAGASDKWSDRITLSGAIEVEAAWERFNYNNSAQDDEEASDIALATAEIGLEARIAEHVSGHIVLVWSEDDTEPVDLDEGFILVDGEDACPFYLAAGRMGLPFGRYESHMVSDPLTLELGEIGETALQVGVHNDVVDVSIGLFNGDIDKAEEENDRPESYFISAVITLPEKFISGFGLTAGASYLSNLGDSNGLQDQSSAGTVQDYVAGAGLFISAAWRDTLFCEVEYIGALDEFEDGELECVEGGAKPRAWNFELAAAPVEALVIAVRYGGSRDGGDFLPEKQYGLSLSYELFENTTLAFEYLRSVFENDDVRDALTAKLGVEF